MSAHVLFLLARFPQLQALAASFFPAGAALFAAAASVSKTRCEVDTAAAFSVAEQIAFPEYLDWLVKKGRVEPERGDS